jgi:sporulation protein YlmC with PRC-barrel domain
MNIPINTAIACADGPCGQAIALILNPVSDQVTHLVVREPGLLGVEYLTPVEFVIECTSELIRLSCTKDELAKLPPFMTTSYLSASSGLMPGYGTGVMPWPDLSTPSDLGFSHTTMPPDEVAIHRGAPVQAADGRIGAVEEFVVDPANNGITDVVLREGHLWNRQDVTIPVTYIDHIGDDIVYLTLNKHQIAALPALAVHRRSR